jgi:hypothetical protein
MAASPSMSPDATSLEQLKKLESVKDVSAVSDKHAMANPTVYAEHD